MLQVRIIIGIIESIRMSISKYTFRLGNTRNNGFEKSKGGWSGYLQYYKHYIENILYDKYSHKINIEKQ